MTKTGGMHPHHSVASLMFGLLRYGENMLKLKDEVSSVRTGKQTATKKTIISQIIK